MQISSQYNSPSVINTVSGAKKPVSTTEEIATDQSEVNATPSTETTPAGIYFNSWSQQDKDIFNKLTENMSGFERSTEKVKLYLFAVARSPENQDEMTNWNVTADDVSVGEMLEKTLRDFTTLAGGSNLEDEISFLQDFIKLREAGYSSVDTRA